MTLVEFLTARLRDDEALAHSVPGPSWERRQITSTFDESEVFEDYVAVADPERNRVVLSDVDARVLPFVLRFDPARVLREVESKRRIMELHTPVPGTAGVLYCPTCSFWTEPGEAIAEQLQQAGIRIALVRPVYAYAPCEHLKLLALPYADHPDYNPEWRG